MTELLFRADAYRRTAPARVLGHTPEGALLVDASLFYPAGGGQPGDRGHLDWAGGGTGIADTVKGPDDAAVLVPAADAPLPPVGADVVQHLDWDFRHAVMRMHTALHLLSVVLPYPVTGGAIGPEKSRLDFDMAEAPEDREALEAALNALVTRDLPVGETWITEAELDARPDMVKTMAVKPPRGQGRVRLVRIGTEADQVDLQACGGTHVARTGEIGALRIGKIEKKGRQNRRVSLHLG